MSENGFSKSAKGEAAAGTSDQGMNIAKDGWYTELGSMWPGQGLSLQVKEVLYRGRSQYQDIAVFESAAYGRVLVLDGVIQCTDRDEFSYQEMMTHLPLCALERPAQRALVVGGGDGGVLRELARHPSLQEIHIAEIDAGVIEASKRYFPGMSIGFSDLRVTVNVCDGIKFVQDAAEGSYDVIIVDSSDPVGPAEVLFQQPFFEAMHRALRPGGVICTQAESLWLHLDIISSLADMCKQVFVGGSVTYAYTTIPTYPSGQIGMMLCCKEQQLDLRAPRQPAPGPNKDLGIGPLRYYNSEVHKAAFVLPQYAADALKDSLTHR
eukprot:GHUV01006241.1.p1 GENE.GHUV01006241.1~~GHUV01006241.1.p1  ORF type:complete len:322 (+),score=76.82 GHUV01006241.1:184-1149(+)